MTALRNPGPAFWISGSIGLVVIAALTWFTISATIPLWTGIGLVLIVAALALNNLYAWAAIAGLAFPLSPIFVIEAGGATVAFADIFAILAILVWAVHTYLKRDTVRPAAKAFWIPVGILVAFAVPYLVVALIDTALFYPSMQSFLSIAQRAELIIVWIVFGAILGFTKNYQALFIMFVAGSAALGVLWMGGVGQGAVFGMQKNPSGGFIAAAILIMLLSNLHNLWRLPLLAVLGAGLVATGSRGSILGLAVALVFVAVFRSQWKRTLIPLGLVLVGGIAGFFALPNDMRARLLSQGESASYNTNIRGTFIADALQHFHAHPWYGIGVGNYAQTDSALSNVATKDPHNVYALTLAEGGYPLLVAFALLTLGTSIWVLVTHRKNTLVILAVSVQIGILVHTAVDVYWVRGTPSIGWLLIGIAAAAAARATTHRKHTSEESDGVPPDATASVALASEATPVTSEREHAPASGRIAHGRRRRY
jgi:O-antigen ligase